MKLAGMSDVSGRGVGAQSVCQTAGERNEQVGKTRGSHWVEKEGSTLIAVKGRRLRSERVQELKSSDGAKKSENREVWHKQIVEV